MRKWLIFGVVAALVTAFYARQRSTPEGPLAWRIANEAAAARSSAVVIEAAKRIDLMATKQPTEPQVLMAQVYAHEILNERANRGAELVLSVKNPMLRDAVKLFLSGRDEAGAETYFSALENASPGELESFYATVLPLVEVEFIDTLSTRSHPAWIRSIWQQAANADGMNLASRMGTHFRRLNHVAQTYRSERKRAATRVSYRQIDEPRHLEHLGLDDRGVVYLLNGEPNQKIGGGGGSTCHVSESWLYSARAHIIVHFAQLETANQYVLISDPEDLCPEGQPRIDVLEALRAIDPQYSRLLQFHEIAGGNVALTNLENQPETSRRVPGPDGSFEQIRRQVDVHVRQMAQVAVHPLTRRSN